jgi:hypothetical protein
VTTTIVVVVGDSEFDRKATATFGVECADVGLIKKLYIQQRI